MMEGIVIFIGGQKFHQKGCIDAELKKLVEIYLLDSYPIFLGDGSSLLMAAFYLKIKSVKVFKIKSK